jgi:hypothetical protein
MSSTYHQLGTTAQDRGRLDEAEDWYRKSLTIKEEFGNRPGMALTYAQLGLLAEAWARAPLALQWTIRCVTLFDQFPSPMTGTGPTALARLTRQLGMPALEAGWRQLTGQPVPQAVRDYITSHDDEDSDWRQAMTDPPQTRPVPPPRSSPLTSVPTCLAEVEAALAARDTQQRPGRYLARPRWPA